MGQGKSMDDDKAIDMQLKDAKIQAEKAATEYMYKLTLNRQLPHVLEDYYVKAVRIGAEPPYIPGQVIYAPLDAVIVPDDEPLPAAFVKAGITREHSQSVISRQQGKDRKLWESEFSSDRPFNPKPQFHTVIDDKDYLVAYLKKEPGVERAKIIGARLRTLGYKGGRSYYYSKKLSEQETLVCSFDFGTWRNSLNSHFSYGFRPPGTEERITKHNKHQCFNMGVTFIYWTIGMQEYPQGISVMGMPHTTEKNLMLTFDNIAFLAKKLEEEIVPQWRQLALKWAEAAK